MLKLWCWRIMIIGLGTIDTLNLRWAQEHRHSGFSRLVRVGVMDGRGLIRQFFRDVTVELMRCWHWFNALTVPL